MLRIEFIFVRVAMALRVEICIEKSFLVVVPHGFPQTFPVSRFFISSHFPHKNMQINIISGFFYTIIYNTIYK